MPRGESIDYEETFINCEMSYIHVKLAIVAHLDVGLFQMDIKITFLMRDLHVTTKSALKSKK